MVASAKVDAPVAETKVDEVEVLQVAVAKVGAINPALNPKR